jgi:hypothetical protein
LIGRSTGGLLALVVLGGQGGLPDPIRRTLTQRFQGWEFPTLSPGFEASPGSGASPAWIAGDFDGDGRLDYAVQLVAPSSGGSVQRVLAFLRRGQAYTLVRWGRGLTRACSCRARCASGSARCRPPMAISGALVCAGAGMRACS